MRRPKKQLGYLSLAILLSNGVTARRINNTIYDTNPTHITYEPREDFCAKWNEHVFWRTCELWAKPWRHETYRSQGKVATYHRSLDHELSSMIIEFEGSAVWVYGPPRSQLFTIPMEYKICLHQNHRVAPDVLCYRVNVAEAYSAEYDYEAPVVIFAKGGLQHYEHRVVLSLAEPIGELDSYQGIQFSHAVYTTERSTPWPVEEDAWRFRQVIMHNTHPLLSYWPREPINSGSWRTPFVSGWTPKTYTAEDGIRVSYHELQSRDEEGRDRWGVDAMITAGAVALYGIPKAHITDSDYLSSICVRIDSGPCEIVDVKHAYLSEEHHHEAVLLWRNDALDPDHKTHVAIRLGEAKSERMTVFPFKELRYYEKQEYSSPDRPFGQVQTISTPHDDEAIVYHPGRRCMAWKTWWCSEWFDPWVWKEAAEGLTYRSTVWSYRESEDPSITLQFQGLEVYVYGAPKSLIRGSLASQHVCINDVCHLIDTEQAYLNAPGGSIRSVGSATSNITSQSLSPELQPVLLWSQTGLDDQIRHTLRLALAPLHSEDNAEMTIAKITYTTVLGQPRPDTPIPPPDESYEGPLFPPYAKKWVPRPPPPPPSEPEPEPEPKPKPEPEPSTSQPEPTQPSTTNPPKHTHPADPAPYPTQPPSPPSPPYPSPSPEPPETSIPFGWVVCLVVLGVMVVMKRRADQKRRELQALLDNEILRVNGDNNQYYWGPQHGYGSTIYEGSSRYGDTSYGCGNNYGRGTNYGGSSTRGSTATPGNENQNYDPPPSYTQCPTYHAGRSGLSGVSTNLPSYSDVTREQRVRALRTAEFVAQQNTRR
ncbi:unnamed protein product [Rhizoctonia solani]|uniref:Transmembrane protein n=1 Tax=Rhizoctonia solani TaxID=456999 RepID=A0A8H3BT40_9AGAM|nr:unnamed protein product [Rhizoctonia solani]